MVKEAVIGKWKKVMEQTVIRMCRSVVTIFLLTIYIAMPVVAEEPIIAKDTEILAAIADAHTIPVENTLSMEQAQIEDPNAMQNVDPTKPADLLFIPNFEDGAMHDDKDGKQLTLTAIFIGKDRKVAVINGTLVKEGEVIAGKTVQTITEDTVRLQDKKELLELKLPVSLVKGAL